MSYSIVIRVKRVLVFTCCFLNLTWVTMAQEGGVAGNCGNGIDDDGDGYIDCYDGECSGDNACAESIVGQPEPDCQGIPDPSTGMLSLQEKWRTTTVMDNRQTPIVGDIDNDGIPEVVGKDDRAINSLFVFDGRDGSEELTINSPSTERFLDAVAIADIDGDDLGEIFIVGENDNTNNPDANDRSAIFCYEHNGTLKWRSTDATGGSANKVGNDMWTLALADFDQDGTPEIYAGDRIFSSVDGELLATGGQNKGASPGASNEPFSVAVDVLNDAFCTNCSGLELVAGNQVYSVNLSTGTMIVEVDFTANLDIGVPPTDGPTSIADLDFDGDLDAVIITRLDVDPTPTTDDRAVVYAWDLQTATQMGTAFQVDAATSAGSNVTTVGGHCNVADFNGDGTLEIGLAGNDVYVVIDYDEGGNTFSELWSNVVQDGSQRTGSSVFDFEGDGSFEVVYKDELNLYIYDGATGNVRASVACGSGTRFDLPVVADVDSDGQTDIVCACADTGGASNADNGYIIAFEASTDPWVKARKLFNQHSYFVANINDDLSVPRVQQTHNIGFPQSQPVRYPLNAFLTQTTELNINGLPTYSVPDPAIAINDPATDITFSGVCGSGTIDIDMLISNFGDDILSNKTPISLYNGDPFTMGAGTFITTTTLGVDIPVDGKATVSVTIPDQGGASFDLWIVTNHEETATAGNPPIPDPLTTNDFSSPVIECNPNNNVVSVPFVSGCGLAIEARADAFTIDEDQVGGLNGDVLADNGNGADNDPQGDLLTVNTTPLSGPFNGGLSLNANGTFSYTPNAEYNGTDTFSYEICDDGVPSSCASASVTITINSVNDIPDAVDDNESVHENNVLVGDVTSNDFAPDGELTTLVSGVTSGTLVWNGDGTYSYTPNANFSGGDSFVYEICDDLTSTCDQATVNITVTDNEAIYSVNTAQNVESYSNSDQLATVSDADGTITSVVLSSGSLPAGTSLNGTTGEITVSDATMLSAGTTMFDITTTDVLGGVTTQTVNITINPDAESTYTVNTAENVDSYSDSDQLASVSDTDGSITSAVLASGSLPAGTSLDGTTGEITVSDATMLVSGTTMFDVTTTDVTGGVTTQTVSITINPDAESTYSMNPAQNVDSYGNSDQLASVSDTNGSITSAVLASGSLPSGTSLNGTTGEITVSDATMLVSGTTMFDITTTDATGGVTTQTVSITINPDAESSYSVNAAQNIDSYSNSDQLASVSDTDGSITSAVLASGSLPAGTSLNGTTGEITVSDATMLVSGTTLFDVTTTDATGGVTTQTVSITINPDAESIYSVNTAQNIESYGNGDQLATVADTDGSITSAVLASGSLPAGTSLNGTTGEITVSDATMLVAGTIMFDITTTDATGGITTQTVTISINPDTESSYAVNTAQNVDSYSNNDQLATVSDTDGSITSAVLVAGSLPAGTSLNSTTGEILVSDATMLSSGTTMFDITTTDVLGGITTQTVNISINPDAESTYTVNTAQNVESYNNGGQLATVTDTNGSITSAVLASGSLPAGTSLDGNTGEIMVTDATMLLPGTTTFDITTTDNTGGVTTQTVSITILDQGDIESVYTAQAPIAIDQLSENQELANVSDSDGAVVNVIVNSGDLPPGVVIDSNGAISVGNLEEVTVGEFEFEVTTTDEFGGTTTQTVILTILPISDGDGDGDGITNTEEDLNGDGNPHTDDTDEDGTPNFLDTDSDGDGIIDEEEGNVDTDSDGISDYVDLDSDADGISDEDEANGENGRDQDCDNDGIPDFKDAFSCEKLESTTVITVNNDGINDGMEIQGIENFPDNEIHIYNRWGNLVWQATGYNNASTIFQGFSNDQSVFGNSSSLPDGTYFYVLDKGDGSSLQKGFVVIRR